MYRRSRFIIGLIAAVVTFGGLMATMGPEHFQRAWHWHPRMENCCMYNDERMNRCDERMSPYDGPERYGQHDRYLRNEPAAPPRGEMRTDTIRK